MEPFKMRKKREKNDLIWHVAGEMVKKQGRASFYISCNYSCTSYFFVKILLVKLKNCHTPACLKLIYCTTKQRLQRWWNLSKLVTNTFDNFGIFFNSIILCPLFSQEKTLFGRNGQCPSDGRIMMKTCCRVLLGGMSKNEQTQFLDSKMYLQQP